MWGNHFLIVMVFIFVGAVLLSTVAIYLRQSMLVAYIFVGLLLGPYGAKLIPNAEGFSSVGEVGIVFLLFLVGLNLDPRELYQSLKQVSLVTFGASGLICLLGILTGCLLQYNFIDSIFISIAMIFSSTVIGLKLMSKESLFHSRQGELMIGILLLQDLLAIMVLFFIEGARTNGGLGWDDLLAVFTGMPSLLVIAFLGKRFVIRPLANHFWHVKEYIFLLAIAWCLGLAQLAVCFGLSNGVGAFIGGVTIASSSDLANFMRVRLNPLRDFFLVLFFFAVGAGFDYRLMESILLPGILLCIMIIVLKPLIYYVFFRSQSVAKSAAVEVSIRLGQASEFSLLVCALAGDVAPRLISLRAEHTIEFMTVLSFILSSYYVVKRYPLPAVDTHSEH